MKSDDLICTFHEEIINACLEQLENLPPEQDLPPEFSGIHDALRSILNAAEKALEAGQAMEDRLTDYYLAIKSLGFVRDRKAGK